jgi:tRNA (guanine-N7-)-methyltransferase
MTEGPAGTPSSRKRTLYGRRRGRRLRSGQQELLEQLLPRLRFAAPEDGVLDPRSLFPLPVDDVWIEIGFGGGEHLAAQAAAHPAIGFIGCEVFENGVVKLLGEVRRLALDNVRILVDDARLLVRAAPEASVGRVFALFPDPWPKLRHHKRRFIQREVLDQLAHAMKDGAELRLATDDVEYLRWMLERVPVHPDFEWLARGPGDWRARPADWPATRYEHKAVAGGRTPAFLRFRRRARAPLLTGRGNEAPLS